VVGMGHLQRGEEVGEKSSAAADSGAAVGRKNPPVAEMRRKGCIPTPLKQGMRRHPTIQCVPTVFGPSPFTSIVSTRVQLLEA
jgi:hypothetical protein